MASYFESFTQYLTQHLTDTIQSLSTKYIQQYKLPNNDQVFNLFTTLQQSPMTAAEILPVLSLVRVSFDIVQPCDWIEKQILSQDQLTMIQLKFQEHQLDFDILKLGQTPIQILDEYVAKQLPETINQANLKQILTQMIQTINILSQNQLKQSQQFNQLQSPDQIKFIQEQVNQHLNQSIDEYKAQISSYTNDLFKIHLDEVQDTFLGVLEDELKGLDGGDTRLQNIKQKFQVCRAGFQMGKKSEEIQEDLRKISTHQATESSQVTQRRSNISNSQLKFSQLVPNQNYSQLKTYQSVDLNDMNYRINTIAQQTSRALEAINITLKDINKRIEDVRTANTVQSKAKEVQRLASRVQQLEWEMAQVTGANSTQQ